MADTLHRLDTIHFRHHMIHEYHIVFTLGTHTYGLFSRRSCYYFHAISSEYSSGNTQIHWLIIYYKGSYSVTAHSCFRLFSHTPVRIENTNNRNTVKWFLHNLGFRIFRKLKSIFSDYNHLHSRSKLFKIATASLIFFIRNKKMGKLNLINQILQIIFIINPMHRCLKTTHNIKYHFIVEFTHVWIHIFGHVKICTERYVRIFSDFHASTIIYYFLRDTYFYSCSLFSLTGYCHKTSQRTYKT